MPVGYGAIVAFSSALAFDGTASEADLDQADWTLESRVETVLAQVGLPGHKVGAHAAPLVVGALPPTSPVHVLPRTSKILLAYYVA